MAVFDGKKMVSGTKQTLRTLRGGLAAEVYLAADAAGPVTEPVRQAAQAAGVPVREISSMKELGRLCGIHVGCACAALLWKDSR